MPANLYRSPVPEQLWDRIRDEFKLPTLEQLRERFAAVHEDPEPVMRQLVRVEEGTFCPGFQFRPDLPLNPVVVGVFERALELRIPHNYFALWMMVPSPALDGRRPVDLRESRDPSLLRAALDRLRVDVAA
ncbi:MbcA/ParS/Xre antitoxin family protein [Paenarthrobacter aromaticivorans]|uniref:MbcA/ParS/Xre antitoxin family protein n=1 Tax=Paenarthrobacter aromaticivorans TaxID=2849150 RepID=A0ABS6I8B7_9MICC|nr:MbcA/ParS/Xre antitoxin family protein [Paenarthrobacter sp. MMS21-TAE1-1]MBU8867854.1 MbcA/ParS/Xre antitoxin family protein [Paenarthrobacter sp. MMS21-TAE1-1]